MENNQQVLQTPAFIILQHARNCRLLGIPARPCDCDPAVFFADEIPASVVQVRPGLWVDSARKRKLCDMQIAKVSE